MQKIKISMLSIMCCCAREDEDTPQPTANLESKRNGETILKNEENNRDTLKLEVTTLNVK